MDGSTKGNCSLWQDGETAYLQLWWSCSLKYLSYGNFSHLPFLSEFVRQSVLWPALLEKLQCTCIVVITSLLCSVKFFWDDATLSRLFLLGEGYFVSYNSHPFICLFINIKWMHTWGGKQIEHWNSKFIFPNNNSLCAFRDHRFSSLQNLSKHCGYSIYLNMRRGDWTWNMYSIPCVASLEFV